MDLWALRVRQVTSLAITVCGMIRIMMTKRIRIIVMVWWCVLVASWHDLNAPPVSTPPCLDRMMCLPQHLAWSGLWVMRPPFDQTPQKQMTYMLCQRSSRSPLGVLSVADRGSPLSWSPLQLPCLPRCHHIPAQSFPVEPLAERGIQAKGPCPPRPVRRAPLAKQVGPRNRISKTWHQTDHMRWEISGLVMPMLVVLHAALRHH